MTAALHPHDTAARIQQLEEENAELRARVARYESRRQPLTERQRAVFDYLEVSIRDRGFAPSFEDIARHFGFRSLASVHEHLQHLARKGWIARDFNKARALRILPESPAEA